MVVAGRPSVRMVSSVCSYRTVIASKHVLVLLQARSGGLPGVSWQVPPPRVLAEPYRPNVGGRPDSVICFGVVS